MSMASGVQKKVILAVQASGLGVPAVAGLATAIYLRRVSSNLDMTKATYQSNEIRPDRQIGDMRHGVRDIAGTISGELSPGSYQQFMAAILRQAWQTAATSGAKTDVISAVTVGAAGTFTSATAAWITAGFKVGDVVRFTGFAVTTTNATANNAHNFLITALTATIMTGIMLDGIPIIAKSESAAVTCTLVGKKTFTPITAHTEQYFSIEHSYTDITQSELFTDCKVNTLAVKLPASGMATIDVGIMGLNMTPGTAQYFTSVLAAATGGVLASVNGALYVQAVKVALLTGMDFDIAANLTSEGVVGSNIKPNIFDGKVAIKGNMTVFFENETFRNYFDNETEISINAVFTTSNLPGADFLAFSFPRVKVGGASKDDGEKGIIQTMPFVALFNTAGGATVNTEDTTMSVQDSTVV